MMNHDVYSRITESISISEAIEGNSSMVEESCSSRIRPLPPRHDFKESEITFGMCVDVFIDGSWREGVLVGRKCDYSKMLVFFPDTGGEDLVLASQIRLTQDWNEVSGHWRHRGLWLFLQIIQKIWKKKFVLSEIKEMWLHLKATEAFREKIKIWYSGSKLMWKELVLNVIRGTKSAVSSLPAAYSSSFVQQLNGCWAHERVEISSNMETLSLSSISQTSDQFQEVKNVHARKQKLIEPHILDLGQKSLSGVEIYTEMKEVDGHQEDEMCRNNDEDSKIVLSSVCDIKISLEKKKYKKRLASRVWKPVQLKGEYCHDLLELSCSSHADFKNHSRKDVKPRYLRIQKVKLRRHLVSTGWRIESTRDACTRFRYISPEQSIYYSLLKVFQYLLKEKTKMSGEASDKGSSKVINSDHNLQKIPPAKEDFVSLKHEQIMHPIDAGLSATQGTTELLCGESDSSGLMNCKVIESKSPEFIGENTQAPGNYLTMFNGTLDSKEIDKYEDTKALHLAEGVVKAYIDHINMLQDKQKLSSVDVNKLRSKTKDFLLEKGWEFWQYDKKVRLELRYTSPNGRTYLSLYAACKGYMEEAHYKNTGKMSFEVINDDKSLNCVSNNLTSITANKEEAHELPCGSGLITPDNQKSLLMQKRGLEQEPFSSSNLSDSEFDSKEHVGRKMKLNRRKKGYRKSLVLQKKGLEQGSFSCSNLSDSGEFDSKEHLDRKGELKKRIPEYQKSLVVQKEGLDQGSFSSSNLSNLNEFDSKEHLGRKRELKRRKIEYPNTHLNLDKKLQNNYCDQKHAVKMDALGASCSHKPSSRSLTSRMLRSGKRSRWAMVLSSKDQVAKTVLSWLIDKDVVLPRQKLAFVRKTDGLILKTGWITHDGIKCRCCLNVFPLSQFGVHAGSRTSRPSSSIVLEDGRSLLDCQKQVLSAFKPNKFQHARLRSDYSNHETDDICTICRDGGLIMLCDLCPSAFHTTCIGLAGVPEGKWFCPSCRCGICGLSEFNCDTENFTQNSGIYCDQCERQYHVGCLQKQGLQLKKCPTGTWTCSKACSKIISHLRLLLGMSNTTHVKGLYWTILRSNIEDVGKLDDESIVENSGMLHIALDVLHECFESMVEARTQSDLATDIIFNNTSELNRLNFRGFYTMLLKSGDEVVGVATFRIFGERLAELPFIGTRVKFRRQGMCRIMMNELQKLLSSLGVERLLLPAVPELLKMWTSSFGFTKITSSDMLGLVEHSLLTFEGTTMCQKFLKKPSDSTA